MILSQALKECRAVKGWTQDDLAKYSGVSLPTIKRYESGNDNATTTNLRKIASAFDIDVSFFLSANLSVKNVRQKENSPQNLSVNQSINNKNLSISMSLSQAENLSLSPQNLSLSANASPENLNEDFITIPFYKDIRASAGKGAYNDIETSEPLSLSKNFLREYFGLVSFINLSIIISYGDSMYPTLPENCYLLIQQGEVKEGEICVIRIDDELYVKRLQKRPKLKLLSDNKAYEPIELNDENYEILGRVIGYFKKTTL